MTFARAGRAALLLLLARWTWMFLVWPMREDTVGVSFLHVISLPFHEAGHIVFSPFGELMMSFGGSLTQVLVPVICWIAFVTTSPNPFGAAVMCWWAGENMLDVAVYINDARSLTLTLLGGRTGAEVEGHDWERTLQLTGLTMHDHQIAWTAHAIGAVMMLAGLLWGASLFRRASLAGDVARFAGDVARPFQGLVGGLKGPPYDHFVGEPESPPYDYHVMACAMRRRRRSRACRRGSGSRPPASSDRPTRLCACPAACRTAAGSASASPADDGKPYAHGGGPSLAANTSPAARPDVNARTAVPRA